MTNIKIVEFLDQGHYHKRIVCHLDTIFKLEGEYPNASLEVFYNYHGNGIVYENVIPYQTKKHWSKYNPIESGIEALTMTLINALKEAQKERLISKHDHEICLKILQDVIRQKQESIVPA